LNFCHLSPSSVTINVFQSHLEIISLTAALLHYDSQLSVTEATFGGFNPWLIATFALGL
jgi:hypothetical protein